MVTTIDSIHSAADYAEMARRPFEAEQCALVVIDIQEKLLPPIFQKDHLVKNTPAFNSSRGNFEDSGNGQHAVCEGVGRNGRRTGIPAHWDGSDGQDLVLLFRR
jgi:hypothetical protein